jgi:hypothetical protein
MAERSSSGGERPPQITDPRRTANPPHGASKDAPGPAKTPKSSPDAAIPVEKLNAGNDK